MTKREAKILSGYRMSRKYSLYDAYGSFSKAKADAWNDCKKLCDEKKGKGLKVIGANSSFFSAGFLFEEDGEEKLMYITHGGNYEISIREDK